MGFHCVSLELFLSWLLLYYNKFCSMSIPVHFFSLLKKKMGIDRIHPHLCRHTFATAYIIGGGSLEMLRLLLGHSDYEVTRSYLHLAHQCQLLHSDVYYLDPIYFKKLS